MLLTETLAKVEYSFPDAIEGFIQTVEQRDPYLKGHMRRVCELAVAIADKMQVPDSAIRAASYAALLHDIGKLGLPQSVLNKPGRLTDDEFAVLKEHPTRGFALVANIESLRSAAPAIRWHHERLDGTGYPDGLAGDAIPLEARIIAVADVWDALTSDRVYRKAMSAAEARSILIAERGSQARRALRRCASRRHRAAEPGSRPQQILSRRPRSQWPLPARPPAAVRIAGSSVPSSVGSPMRQDRIIAAVIAPSASKSIVMRGVPVAAVAGGGEDDVTEHFIDFPDHADRDADRGRNSREHVRMQTVRPHPR